VSKLASESESARVRVLHAHPDRWTIGADYPPEERARMRAALVGFATEWLGAGAAASAVAQGVVVEDTGDAVEDTDEQHRTLAAWRDALAAWRASRDARANNDALPALVAAALDAVLAGAVWESPRLTAGGDTVSFHRAWRVIVDLGDRPREVELGRSAERFNLIVRDR
jgi:hypothetical protein